MTAAHRTKEAHHLHLLLAFDPLEEPDLRHLNDVMVGQDATEMIWIRIGLDPTHLQDPGHLGVIILQDREDAAYRVLDHTRDQFRGVRRAGEDTEDGIALRHLHAVGLEDADEVPATAAMMIAVIVNAVEAVPSDQDDTSVPKN